MADLQGFALRDTLRELRFDIEGLRRRSSSSTFVSYGGNLTAATTTPLTTTTGTPFPTSAGTYARAGDAVTVVGLLLNFITGFGVAGSGAFRLPLPIATAVANASSYPSVIGRALFYHAATTATTPVDVVITGNSLSYMQFILPAGTYADQASNGGWGIGDYIRVGTLVYRCG